MSRLASAGGEYGAVCSVGRLAAARPAFELIDFHRYLFPQWNDALERQLLDRFGLSTGSKIKQLSKGEARQVPRERAQTLHALFPGP